MLTKENFSNLAESYREKIKLSSNWDACCLEDKPRPRPGGETSNEHLIWMLNYLEENFASLQSKEIYSWIGFIQGVMLAKGYLKWQHGLGLLEF